jgi:hypothetical protein
VIVDRVFQIVGSAAELGVYSECEELTLKNRKIRFAVIPENPGSGQGEAPEAGFFK